MDREVAFGRLLAIANVLSERVFEEDKIKISTKHMARFGRTPAKTFEKIHSELMEYAHKFGEIEHHLIGMFEEILANMNHADFSNEPLSGKYLQGYHAQQYTLNNIMGVEEAAELWGYSSPGTVKNMCAEGKVIATKIGKTWVIDRKHPNPKQSEKPIDQE